MFQPWLPKHLWAFELLHHSSLEHSDSLEIMTLNVVMRVCKTAYPFPTQTFRILVITLVAIKRVCKGGSPSVGNAFANFLENGPYSGTVEWLSVIVCF